MPRSPDTLPMFHRRLLLLWSGMLLAFAVLAAQMVRLAVAGGEGFLATAESTLDRSSLLPTYRGRILDRNGVLLAADRASFDICVPFEVVTGSWESRNAARAARRESGRAAWDEMTDAERDAAARACRPEFERQTDELWALVARLGGLTAEEVAERRDEIRAEVNRLSADVWENQRERWEQEQAERGRDRPFRPQTLLEHEAAHVILAEVSDEVAFAFRTLGRRHEGLVEIRDAGRREYPWNDVDVRVDRDTLPGPLQDDEPLTVRVAGVADHIVGTVRDEVWQEDTERRPFVADAETGALDLGGYLEGDLIGARGLELVFERHLRGERGRIIERIDSGETHRIDPLPGHDLHVTLDIMLQARVQGILSHELGLTVVQPWHGHPSLPAGWPLDSAAVVIEIATGEVLAMVSMPTLAMGRDMTDLELQMHRPQYNRVVEAIYPPGSIIKPLVLVGAVNEGVYDLGDPITCTGHFFPQATKSARCWIYRDRYGLATHGDMHAAEAIGQSCNIFFYSLADELGMARLVSSLGRFGAGAPIDTGLFPAVIDEDGRRGLAGAVAGDLPDQAYIERQRETGRLRSATVMTGIGQGPITWTPLHAANAYATLAREGKIRDATLLLEDPRGVRPANRPDVPISRRLRETILAGLRISVSETRGTGHHITYEESGEREPIINATGVRVWAKTGTAQAPPLRVDSNGDGVIDVKNGDVPIQQVDHSWYVGLVGPAATRQPLYSIAVIVEHGGSGGRVAGPIANQIIHALQAEHYLPSQEPSS